ncbi:MAG TPA: FAD/NAD(P)-binding protein [Candidatus Limnocylindrales bacterium]|nr:FAD/NAD(P)-binding protein [Candidatus Limnocylindrales bacterium]
MSSNNPLMLQKAIILDIHDETPDIKTFRVAGQNGLPFDFMPGQCAMISLPPVGEAIFSITSSPTCRECLEFSIKDVGSVSGALHALAPGQELGVRGPYGNGFPLEQLRGKDLLFIGGGIGLAPLRSLIGYCLAHRDDFGKIDIVYGARSPADLIRKSEITTTWPTAPDTKVHLTVDAEVEGWNDHVGFVPSFVGELAFAAENRMAITCGPPIMIKFVLQTLEKLHFLPEQVITTLEMRMKCGIGKCGRCNIGPVYVCKDGPVFSLAQLNALPAEY